MLLRERISEILDYINGYDSYLDHNKKLLDIHQGNLRPYVEKDLESCLSKEYYAKMKDRLIIINILQRFIDKVSKVYALTPMRTVKKTSASDEKLLEFYENKFDMNVNMNDADEYANLFKGYLLDPYIDENEPHLRVSPFDRFLVKSDSSKNPLKTDLLIKFMGEKAVKVEDKRQRLGYRTEMREVFYLYTDEEFLAIDDRGDIYEEGMRDQDGTNIFGIIPAFYGFRSRIDLIPRQDTDLLGITKIIPVLLSDLSGAVLFQCFSIMYGVDVDAENLVMSPNAFWSFKSDPTSDRQPTVGVIKPEADIDKVLNFIMQVFTLWLESKGIKIGAVGQMDGAKAANGISKIIDEMDTTELKKLNIKAFKRDEERFWQVLKSIHNTWVTQGLLTGHPKFSEAFEVGIDFDEPIVVTDREKEVRTVSLEVDAGFLYPEKAIRKLYPDAEEDEIAKHLEFYEQGANVDGEMAEDDDTNIEEV